MKGLYLIVCLSCVATLVIAQGSREFKILPFNEEEFNKKLPDPNFIDSLDIYYDTLAVTSHNPYPMTIIEVPTKSLAPIPNMPIRNDIHYHMQIKRYRNYYTPRKHKLEYKPLKEEHKKPGPPPRK